MALRAPGRADNLDIVFFLVSISIRLYPYIDVEVDVEQRQK